ncbi:hypothetical protein [Lactiplantibacillus mudanjiangensis]|uniref:MFS transporter [Lactobacillus sp.] n=1 Tax=Lactiplantibacillus mudanjiangensis TaxID=1296538 RepID=A0A660DYZ3_9LACO|nr:hypothetical protein [Lactiplantibacillus mudanjiangensis]VDG25450.1 MFS transporter [Lactobacillus sp.] [Lactiplantibacillus mudanjiangensis]VDG28522.1 MFS transporter [Lactobacillus sp.] [Lactiplantibacillus mudanjiangensis]
MSQTMGKTLAVTDVSTVAGTFGAAWLANVFGQGVLAIVGVFIGGLMVSLWVISWGRQASNVEDEL